MLKVAFSCLVLVAATIGTTDGNIPGQPCCTPERWEGEVREHLGSVAGGQATSSQIHAWVSYDFENKMVMLSVAAEESGLTRNTSIFNYNDKKMYTIHESTGTCVVNDLEVDMLEACIPGDSREVTSYYYGEPGNEMEVTAFTFTRMGLNVRFDMTSAGCIPITETVHGSIGKISMMVSLVFSNITPGIRDQSVFDPPSNCDLQHQQPLTKANVHSRLMGLPSTD